MNRSDIKSITTLSGSNFYEKIIRKYQTGKRKTLQFPPMIFYKNRGCFLPKKITTNIPLQLHITKKNIMSSSTERIIPAMKGIILWFNIENVLPSIIKPKNIQYVANEKNIFLTALKIPRLYRSTSGLFPGQTSTNRISAASFRISTFSFLKSLFFKAETTTDEPNEILKPLFLAAKTAFNQQVTHSVPSDTSMASSQPLNYGNYVQIINPQLIVRTKSGSANTSVYSTIIEKESISKYQTLFERKSPAILSKNNSVFNNTILGVNRFFFENPNWANINKPLIKNFYSSFGHDESSFSQRRYAYTADEKLSFHDQRRMEQEIEIIKKIVIETKESLSDKSTPSFGEAEIKRYLDINRISSQVYQNIERTIKMERERRGM